MKLEIRSITKTFDTADVEVFGIFILAITVISILVIFSCIVYISTMYIRWEFDLLDSTLRALSIGLLMLAISLIKIKR